MLNCRIFWLYKEEYCIITHYPQSNGKVECFHGTIKKECIRKKALLDQDHAKIIIGSYIAFYNNQRLHSANVYITPAD
ncbi:MAG: transposase [Deltaproteobacteria bacterium]|nr:transposase [Deltaproteobacteria bacterium]